MNRGSAIFKRECVPLLLVALAWFGNAGNVGAQGALSSNPEAELVTKYNAANQAFAQSKWVEAASGFQDILHAINAKDVPAAQLAAMYYTVGAAYFNVPDYSKSVEAFRTYLAKFPAGEKTLDAKVAIARACFFNKQYAEALEAFSGLETVPGYREQALLTEAQCYKELGKPDEQVRVLEKLTANGLSTAGQGGAALTLIELYAGRDQPDKAMKLIESVNAKPALIENAIALNSAVVKTADKLAAKRFFAQALDAYRAVRPREEVIHLQEERVVFTSLRIKANIKATGGNAQALAAAVQENSRLKTQVDAAAALLAEYKNLPDYGPSLLIREAKTWYNWDKKWESVVVLDRLLRKNPQSKEREPALFSLLVAYADLSQPRRCQELCKQYLAEFKEGPNAPTVGYLLGATAMQANDPKTAETYFGRMLQEQPQSSYRQEMRFMLASARFAQNEFEPAMADYAAYTKEFPNGQFAEEANFRVALATLFAGHYEDAMTRLNVYLQKYPGGSFRDDAKYRLMVCKYSAQLYAEVDADAAAWRREFPDDPLTGEMLSLAGDSLAAQGKTADAVTAYVAAYKHATTDEVLNYALFEAAKLLQKQGKWAEISSMFEEFVRDKPDHPSAVAAMYWIGKARAREGKVEDAKQFLVGQLKHYIGDPKREAVEQVIQQLVQLTAKRPRPAPATVVATSPTTGTPPSAVTPAATPPLYDAAAELDRQLEPLRQDANATANARLLYARAEMATLQKKPADHDHFLVDISQQYKPADLSPVLLAQVGDALLAKGEKDKAAAFYTELKTFYPKSNYLDFAYVGLGEIAFNKKDYQAALPLFSEAANVLAQTKVKEATIGEAKTLLELGRYEEARKLFEQVASVREWRGEATAYAIYSLGDLESRQGHWDQALTHYQRVVVLYRRYSPWVAKAYLAGALSDDKMGKRQEAVGYLKEMLQNDKLQDLPESGQARQLLDEWGAAA